MSLSETQQAIEQRRQQIASAQEQVESFNPQIQRTQKSLRQGLGGMSARTTQQRITALEMQRAEAKEGALGEVETAMQEQNQLEKDFEEYRGSVSGRIQKAQEEGKLKLKPITTLYADGSKKETGYEYIRTDTGEVIASGNYDSYGQYENIKAGAERALEKYRTGKSPEYNALKEFEGSVNAPSKLTGDTEKFNFSSQYGQEVYITPQQSMVREQSPLVEYLTTQSKRADAISQAKVNAVTESSFIGPKQINMSQERLLKPEELAFKTIGGYSYGDSYGRGGNVEIAQKNIALPSGRSLVIESVTDTPIKQSFTQKASTYGNIALDTLSAGIGYGRSVVIGGTEELRLALSAPSRLTGNKYATPPGLSLSDEQVKTIGQSKNLATFEKAALTFIPVTAGALLAGPYGAGVGAAITEGIEQKKESEERKQSGLVNKKRVAGAAILGFGTEFAANRIGNYLFKPNIVNEAKPGTRFVSMTDEGTGITLNYEITPPKFANRAVVIEGKSISQPQINMAGNPETATFFNIVRKQAERTGEVGSRAGGVFFSPQRILLSKARTDLLSTVTPTGQPSYLITNEAGLITNNPIITTQRVGSNIKFVSNLQGSGREVAENELATLSKAQRYIQKNIYGGGKDLSVIEPKAGVTRSVAELESTDVLRYTSNAKGKTLRLPKVGKAKVTKSEVLGFTKKIGETEKFTSYDTVLGFKDVTKEGYRSAGKVPQMTSKDIVLKEVADLRSESLPGPLRVIEPKAKPEITFAKVEKQSGVLKDEVRNRLISDIQLVKLPGPEINQIRAIQTNMASAVASMKPITSTKSPALVKALAESPGSKLIKPSLRFGIQSAEKIGNKVQSLTIQNVKAINVPPVQREATIISKQDQFSIQQLGQEVAQRNKTAQKEALSLKQSQGLLQSPITKNAFETKTAQDILTTNLSVQAQRQSQRQVQRQTQREIQRPTTTRGRFLIKPPVPPPTFRKKKGIYLGDTDSKAYGRFTAEIRRAGKFKQVGSFATLAEAESKALTEVKGGLGRSFRIKRGEETIATPFRAGFRSARAGGNIRVQESRIALASRGEISEIIAARRRSKRGF